MSKKFARMSPRSPVARGIYHRQTTRGSELGKIESKFNYGYNI